MHCNVSKHIDTTCCYCWAAFGAWPQVSRVIRTGKRFI